MTEAQLLNSSPVIKLAEVAALKRRALWDCFHHDDDWRSGNYPADVAPRPLQEYYAGVFVAAERRYGRPWWAWPSTLRHPDSPGVPDFAREHADELLFQAWIQHQCHLQISSVKARLELVLDLPAAVPHHSVDAWRWQDYALMEEDLGAPGDYFSPLGHRWGLVPFDGQRLAADRYGLFTELATAISRFADGVRVDHALGLLRQYRIKKLSTTNVGTYVKQPSDLATAFLGNFVSRVQLVITEEMGTPPAFGTNQLRQFGCSRLNIVFSEQWDESTNDDTIALTDHDLPTTAAVLGNAWHPNRCIPSGARDRLLRLIGVRAPESAERSIPLAYGTLARRPCRRILVPLEDALGLHLSVNIPGLVHPAYPSFLRRLPPMEVIASNPILDNTFASLREGTR